MASGEALTHLTTAMHMWFDYGEPMPLGSHGRISELRFKSGLPFSLYLITGQNEQEGDAIAVVAGDFSKLADSDAGPLIRMHSACLFSEFGENPEITERLKRSADPHDFMYVDSPPSPDCDCRAQREEAQRLIATEGGVYFDLLEQEGRGAGLELKREAYKLQREEGLDTVDAYEQLGIPLDSRQYGHCARFLVEHGLNRVRLLSNNPRKLSALSGAGIEVTMVPLEVGVSESNIDYLRTKRDKAGHTFSMDLAPTELGD